MNRAFLLATSIVWAIQPDWLEQILAIANREGPGPEAVEAQLGRPLANAQETTIRDGVAVIPVTGPIFRHANAFSRISGATSIEILARDFHVALEDPNVDAILLNIDSPGGEVTGTHEMHAMIRSARGRKPIAAYIGGTGASAAYWLASAADEVVADATARVGSIGVYQAIRQSDDGGAKAIEIVSSQSPRKNADPNSKDGRADYQANVDALAEVFIVDVAAGRGVDRDKVISDFGRGGVFVGEAAVRAGLVDRIGSFEGTVTALRERADAQYQRKHMAAFALSIATILGLAAAATEDEIRAAVTDRENEHKELLAVTGKSSAREALGAVAGMKAAAEEGAKAIESLKVLEAKQRAAEIEGVVDAAVKAGKVTPASRAKALELGASMGVEWLRSYVEELPVVANVATSEKALHGSGDAVTLSAEELDRCKRMGWKPEDYAAEKARITGRVGVPNGG